MPRTGSTTLRKILDEDSDICSVHISQVTPEFPFYHHISAPELRSIFSDRGWDWDSYTCFCVVRNPYDRVVSLYHHHLRMLEENARTTFLMRLKFIFLFKPTFRDYVMRIDVRERLPTSLAHFVFDERGHQLVDEILCFEVLSVAIQRLLDRLGIHVVTEDIPHLNASKDRRDYRKYYDQETRSRVRELYEDEIERFGYNF